MSEEKNTPAEGRSSKKTVSRRKSPVKRSQKEKERGVLGMQAQPIGEAPPAVSLVKKIDEIVEEIEGSPLRSFAKTEQEKLLQSYEKLISKMVREINNSRLSFF